MDKNLHFKMYKAGKRWLFAGIASATLMTMGGVSLAHADDTDSGAPVSEVTADTPDDGDVVALSSASIPDSTADDSSSAASEADSTASSAADSTASSATSDAPAVATHSLTGQQTWTDTDLATASFIPVTETGTFKAGDKLTFNYNPNDFAWVKNDTVAGTTVSTNTTAGTVTYTFTQDMTASIAIYVKYNNLPKATSSWANGLQSATSTVSTILNGAALDDLDITVNKVYTFKNPAIYIKNVGSSYGVANEAITSNGTVVSDGILSLNPYGLYQILSNGGNAFTRSSAVVSQDIVFTYSALTNVQIDSVTWLGTLPAGVSYTNTDNTVTITIAAGTPYSTIVSMSSSSVQVNWHTIDGSTKESTPWTGAIITGALDEQSFSYTGTAGQIGTNVSLARIAGGYNINDGSHVSALTEVAQAGNTTKVITIGATATANYIDPNPDNTLSDSEDFSTTNMNYNITGIQTTNGVTYTITLASGQVITIVGDGTMQTLAIDSTVDPIKNIATLALNSGTMIWSTEGALYGNVSLIDPSQLGYMSRTYNSYSAVDNNSGLSATRASNLLPGDILSGIKFITAPSYQMTNSGMVQSDYNAAMTVGAGTGSTIYITVSETGLLTTPFIKAIAVANPVWVLTAPKDTIFGSNGIPTKGLVYTYSADMKTLTITYDPTAVTTTVQYAGTTSQNNSLAVTYTLVPLPSAYPGEVIGQPNVTLTFDNTIVQNLNIETVTNATALARDSFSTDGDRTTIIYDGAQGMLGTVVAPATYYQQTSIQGSGDTAVQASTGTIDLSKSNTLTISDILYDGMKSDVPDTLTTLNLRDSTNQLGVHLTAPIQIVDVDGNPITGATIVYLTAQGIVTTYDQAVSIQISGVSIAQAKIAKIIATVSLDDPDTTIVTGKSLAVTWTTQPLNADGSAISTALSTTNTIKATRTVTASYNLIDSDDSNKVLSTVTDTGAIGTKYDGTVTIPDNYVLVGYQLADGTKVTGITTQTFSEVVGSDGTINGQTYQVLLKHATTSELVPVTETVNYAGLPSDKAVASQNQTVNATKITDLVTGAITWTEAQFDAINSPAVAGYTPNQSSVAATSSTNGTISSVTVTYTANATTATLNIVDTDNGNKVVQSFEVSGVVDGLIDWSSVNDAIVALTDKYNFTSGGMGTTFKADPASNIYQMTVTEKHTTGSYVQTINYVATGLPTAKNVSYDASKVGYDTDTNLVTGVTTYTLGKYGLMQDSDIQDVAGYTATIGAVNLDATSTTAPADQTVNVSYAANAQSITVNYVDDDFSTLTDRHSLDLKTSSLIKTETLDGITDQAVVFTPDYLPAGYVFVNVTGQPATFSSDGGQVITVHYYHHMTDSQFTRTFTIHYVGAGDQTPVDVVYNLLLDEERDDVSGVGLYDLRSVNGERMTSTDWMTTATPEIAGYTALTTSVDYDEFFPLTNQYDYSVSPEDLISDRYTTVTYTPNAQTITVNYVDDDDNSAIVDSNTLNGVTDQAVEFTPSAPANYNLVAGTEIPSTFSADGGQVITVHLTHKTSSQDEAKTISRLVKFVDAKGNDLLPSVLQTANFTRVATTDAATGLVSYTAWVSDNAELNAVNAPALSGLTPDQNGAAAETLTGDSINNVVSVVYSDITAPDMPSEAVTPVSPDGGTTTVSGTAEPNSLVTVITADGSKLTQQTGNDGAYSIDVPSAQIGDVIAVTATDDAGNVSDANQQSVGAAVVQKDVVDDPISVNPDDFYQTVTVEFVDQNGNVIGTSDVKITNHQDVNVNVPTGYSHLNDDGTYTSDVLINDGTDHQQVLVTKIQSQVITDDGGVTNQNGDGQITKTAVGAPLSVNAKDFYDNTAKQVVSPVDPKPIKTETHEPTLKDALIPVETEPKQGASLTQIEDSLDNGVAVLPNTGAAMQQRPELVMVGLSAFLLAITGLLAKKRQDSDK
ncbi:MAG: Ig-like domain-containing protein [Lactobacillaceae bacterium]|jgi:hypothetical protein|nr:Ig-like domain-containing protein [Lactobacillaceae bacterium]